MQNLTWTKIGHDWWRASERIAVGVLTAEVKSDVAGRGHSVVVELSLTEEPWVGLRGDVTRRFLTNSEATLRQATGAAEAIAQDITARWATIAARKGRDQ